MAVDSENCEVAAALEGVTDGMADDAEFAAAAAVQSRSRVQHRVAADASSRHAETTQLPTLQIHDTVLRAILVRGQASNLCLRQCSASGLSVPQARPSRAWQASGFTDPKSKVSVEAVQLSSSLMRCFVMEVLACQTLSSAHASLALPGRGCIVILSPAMPTLRNVTTKTLPLMHSEVRFGT